MILAAAALTAIALPGQAQSLSDAFNQGTALGQSGNAAARGGMTSGSPQTIVPNYTTNPPEDEFAGLLEALAA